MIITTHPKLFFYYLRCCVWVLAVLLPVTILLNSCEHEQKGLTDHEQKIAPPDSVFDYHVELISQSFDAAPSVGDSLINTASAYFNATQNQEGIAEVLFARSARAELQSDYTQALLYADSALVLADKITSVKLLVDVYNMAGIINSVLGHNVVAIEMYNQVYELAESQNDTIGMIYALGNSALVYGEMNDLEKSKSSTYQSLVLAISISDHLGMAIAHLNLGYHYLHEEKIIDSAYYHNSQAIELLNEYCLEELRPLLTINAADIDLSRGKPVTARNTLIGLLNELSGSMSPREQAIARMVLGKTYRYLKKYHQSLNNLREADELIGTMKDAWLKILVEKEFYKTHKAMGNHKIALQYFESYNKKDEEHTGEETQRQIADLKNQSLMRKQEREIASLKLTQLAKQSKTTKNRYMFYFILLAIVLAMKLYYFNYQSHQKTAFATKEKLIAEGKLAILQSRINPDFILNSFGGVQSYLLKSDRMQAYTYLGKFASLLRTVINSNGETFNDLELEASILIGFLELEAMRFQGNLTYEVNVSPELKGSSHKIPGMMIQPYVESAIKEKLASNDRQLHLVVNFREATAGIVVSIIDDDPLCPALQLISIYRKRLAFLRQIGYENARVEVNKNNDNEVLIYLPTT